MTTIIVDFKNKKVVADKQTTHTYSKEVSAIRYFLSDTIPINEKSFNITYSDKIHKVGDVIITGSGDRNEILRLVQKYEERSHIVEPKTDNVTVLVARSKGDGLFVEIYDGKKGKYFWSKPTWDMTFKQGDKGYVTIGSGSHYAYGALMAGVSAEEALVAASKSDNHTSAKYDVMEVV